MSPCSVPASIQFRHSVNSGFYYHLHVCDRVIIRFWVDRVLLLFWTLFSSGIHSVPGLFSSPYTWLEFRTVRKGRRCIECHGRWGRSSIYGHTTCLSDFKQCILLIPAWQQDLNRPNSHNKEGPRSSVSQSRVLGSTTSPQSTNKPFLFCKSNVSGFGRVYWLSRGFPHLRCLRGVREGGSMSPFDSI
jgi:hypothetical protein